jgi:hypothetical protein
MSAFFDDLGYAARILGLDNAHIAYDIVQSTPHSDIPLALALLTQDQAPPEAP